MGFFFIHFKLFLLLLKKFRNLFSFNFTIASKVAGFFMASLYAFDMGWLLITCLSLMNRWGSCPFKKVVHESYWLANAHCWLEIKPLVVSFLSLLGTPTWALCSSSTLIRVMRQKKVCSSQEETQVLSSALSGSCLTIAAWATAMTHGSGPTISSALWGRVIWWVRKTAWPLQKLCFLCFLHLRLW